MQSTTFYRCQQCHSHREASEQTLQQRLSSIKNAQIESCEEKSKSSKSLYDTVEDQTSEAIWNDVTNHADYNTVSQARYMVRLLRVIRGMHQNSITGQQNNPIVDSL